MGKGKGLALLIGGVLAFEYAAYNLGHPGVSGLVSEVVHSNSLGEGIDTMFRIFGYYGRDFLYDKFAELGTAGQLSMYGGLGNLVYNTIKKPKIGKKEEPEKKD